MNVMGGKIAFVTSLFSIFNFLQETVERADRNLSGKISYHHNSFSIFIPYSKARTNSNAQLGGNSHPRQNESSAC
jgi:hypothetical protein